MLEVISPGVHCDVVAEVCRVVNCHCSIEAREWRGGAGGL